MKNLSAPRLSALIDLSSLFAGRIGGILVTLVFIPQYNALLGPATFGAVSVVLSLQAFFLVSDLGLATLISRDTAIARDDPSALTTVVWMRRRAELLLLVPVLGVAVPGVLLPLLFGSKVLWTLGAGTDVAVTALLIAVLVAINIVQLSLNALGRYRQGAATAIVGAIVRGGATVLALRATPTLSSFLVLQAMVAVVHLLGVRWLLERECGPVVRRERWFDKGALHDLLRRCLPLMVYTLAAAAAVNLDKPIISAFVSLGSAGVYFLATTYALVPVAVLSGPLNSYFAPKIAHLHHAGHAASEWRLAALFQVVLMAAVIGPSLSLGLQMESWLRLWLPASGDFAAIMQVAPILLAGGALSATGYYATTYLIAAGDNGYLARLSFASSVMVLPLAVIFAAQGHLVAFAWSYFAFYVVGLLGLWYRIAVLKGWRRTRNFLFWTYLLPGIVIVAGYALGRLLVAGASSPALLLPVPLVASGLAAALALAALIRFVPPGSAR